MPAKLPAINHNASPQNNIRKIYLIFAPAYRHIINPTIPRIITVPRSGINKKTKKSRALSTMNEMKNSFVFIFSRFLISHAQRKSTYPNLKNSAGWMFGKNGRFTHHLAPWYSVPIPGINTASCRSIKMTAMMVIFLFFWKNLIGMAYTIPAITKAAAIFLICFRK